MTEKTVYQCDRAGMYVSQVIADQSPKEPGVFLIPAGCTEIAPPETWPEDQWPRFNGLGWDLVPKPKLAESMTPEQKLVEFLQNNPDVAYLINQ